MTLQERDLLLRFLQQMSAARAGQKDSEAETLINEAVARQPDAAYLLVQRAIQLEQALQATQAQVQKLQAEIEQRSGARTGFLNDNTWGSQSVPVAQNAAPARPVTGAATAAPPASAWGGSMLGNIATTAAGVVAGSFLFQGIDRLMHHGDTSWGSEHDRTAHAAISENATPSTLYDDTPLIDDTDTFADSGDSGDFT